MITPEDWREMVEHILTVGERYAEATDDKHSFSRGAYWDVGEEEIQFYREEHYSGGGYDTYSLCVPIHLLFLRGEDLDAALRFIREQHLARKRVEEDRKRQEKLESENTALAKRRLEYEKLKAEFGG